MTLTSAEIARLAADARKIPVRDLRAGDVYNGNPVAGSEWRRVIDSRANGSGWLIDTDEPNGVGGTGYLYANPDKFVMTVQAADDLPKDVMSSPSDPTCRDLLSSSAARVRAGVQTVELEEAPSEHRDGT